MKKMGMGLVLGLFCLTMGCLFFIGSFAPDIYAASYPDRPITLVVPYPAGGVTDLSARALAEFMEKYLKQPVVVVNKVGGRATIGGYAVVTAKADGYTLGFFPIASSMPEVFSYFYDAPYSSKDFKPISCVAATAMSFLVKADAPWNSFKDIIEFARKNPGMKVGSPGKQTLPYLVMVNVAKKEKFSFVDVPFAGDAATLPALLGGHIPVGAIDYSAVRSLVEAKKLKVLAVCTEKRVDFAPQAPSIVELGYKLAYVSNLGVFGPKAIPDELVKKIDEVVGKITGEQEFREKMKSISVQTFYQDADTYPKSLMQYKETIQAFFKEEGLVK